MANTFQPLECDTDILMIGKDTFTVERFKELTVEKITSFFNSSRYREGSIFDIFRKHIIKIFDNSLVFNLRNIELIFPPEGIESKILKLGDSEWQTGKMRVHVMVINAS
ncbi:MAG: KGK domain-containing protein [Microcoleaceae cyanobacterium]